MFCAYPQTEESQVGPGQLVGYMGEKDGYRIWMPNERKIVVNRDVLFKPEVVCNAHINQTGSMCPTLHVAPTEETAILQNYKSEDVNTASIAGGSNGSNLEIHVHDHKSIREKKEPNWMTITKGQNTLRCDTSV
jgi:hypothetical protein